MIETKQTDAKTTPIENPPTLTWQTFTILLLITSIIPAGFIIAFSAIGYGLEIVRYSRDLHGHADLLLKISTIGIIIAYVIDICNKAMYPIYAVVIISVTVEALLLLTTENPYWPICVMSIMVPLLLVGVKYVFYAQVRTYRYIHWMYQVFVCVGIIIELLFIYWISGHQWNPQTRALYSNRAGCIPDYHDLSECQSDYYDDEFKNHGNIFVPCFFDGGNKTQILFDRNGICTPHCIDVYEKCSVAFIVWANPCLAALSLLVVGFIAKYMEPNTLVNDEVFNVVKLSGILLFFFWIFASLVGAGEGITGSLIMFGTSMVAGAFMILLGFLWNDLFHKSSEFVEGALENNRVYLDFVKGFLVYFSPFALVFLILSMLKQMSNKLFNCFRVHSNKPYNGWFPSEATYLIENVKEWNHAKVLTYSVYWGMAYIFLNVLASKFTTVFLSWLIEYTKDMSIIAVTGIVIFVGLCLFMLPPIPGLPIYLTGGIVLVSIGEEFLGFAGAIVYACVVSLCLKLLACTIQQKLIGEKLGGIVAVRQAISINSDGVRAMRLILSDKEISFRKVAILVGGPDWPVSVLCGILGLDLIPILYGTIPVILVIIPTVLTGSFAFMGSLSTENNVVRFPWADTMGTLSSALAVCVMFYFTFAVAGAVKDTLENHRNEISLYEDDKEVAEADAKAAKSAAIYDDVSRWDNVPLIYKTSLILSSVLMVSCCYLLVLFNAACFKDYDLMYTIDEHLEGNWLNLILPLGWVVLALFACSWFFLSTFKSWAKTKTSHILATLSDSEIHPLTKSMSSNSSYIVGI